MIGTNIMEVGNGDVLHRLFSTFLLQELQEAGRLKDQIDYLFERNVESVTQYLQPSVLESEVKVHPDKPYCITSIEGVVEFKAQVETNRPTAIIVRKVFVTIDIDSGKMEFINQKPA